MLRHRVYVGHPGIVWECPSNYGIFRHRVCGASWTYTQVTMVHTIYSDTRVRVGQGGHPGIVQVTMVSGILRHSVCVRGITSNSLELARLPSNICDDKKTGGSEKHARDWNCTSRSVRSKAMPIPFPPPLTSLLSPQLSESLGMLKTTQAKPTSPPSLPRDKEME